MPPTVPTTLRTPLLRSSSTLTTSLRCSTSPQTSIITTIITHHQTLHTTPSLLAKHSKKRLEHLLRNCPPYPYPIRHTFKQSWFGLYGSAHIQFGNNIPEEERTITRRTWLPNIKRKKLWSFALGQWITTKLSTRVLRTIDKVGGLDAYLLSEKRARLKELGPWGWKLRYRVQKSKSVQKMYMAQRVEMGLVGKKKARRESAILKIRGRRGRVVTGFRAVRDRLRTWAERRRAASRLRGVMYGEPYIWRGERKRYGKRAVVSRSGLWGKLHSAYDRMAEARRKRDERFKKIVEKKLWLMRINREKEEKKAAKRERRKAGEKEQEIYRAGLAELAEEQRILREEAARKAAAKEESAKTVVPEAVVVASSETGSPSDQQPTA